MGPFQVVFEPGVEREITWTGQANRGLRNHRNAFFCQKFIDEDCCVTWGFVVQHQGACNAWSHTCHPFHEYFKDFPIKRLIDNLSWWQKLLLDNPLAFKKTNELRFDFGFAHSRFLGRGEFGVCHSRIWRFVSWS